MFTISFCVVEKAGKTNKKTNQGIRRRLNSSSTGSRLQPLRGDPDNPPPEGTNAIAQARTPQARPSGLPGRTSNAIFSLRGTPFRQSPPCSSYLPETSN